MKNSEADIIEKIIVPFLNSLGFENDELQFEKSFSVQLGHHAVRIDSGKSIKKASPRLDILVKREGRNLFIIEAKSDEKDLTDEDRDQAISYARLVDPMAPIAIVTNGKDFKIYKVGDKTETDRDKNKILGYNIGSEMEKIYDEALEYFIGYSDENVQLFCQAQVEEGMKTLLGSHEKRDRKFIPELYVPSKSIAKAFQTFLSSENPVFALTGESGSGKTCAMCGLAQSLLTGGNPVLFYRAANLTDGIIKSIADDFNWTFSASLDDIALFKRLNKMFKDKNITIFMDGIDEWEQPDKVELLGNFANKIKDKKFKLVVSCKSGQWENFLEKAGTPSDLSEEIFLPDGTTKGYSIEPFDEEDFHYLVEKYQAFYEFHGRFESSVLTECKRSPFLLRVFFEVALKTKSSDLTFSVIDFYHEYYRKVIGRIPEDKDKVRSILTGIAKVLFEKNRDSIDIDVLRKELNLNINDEIMPSLFDCNILEKTSFGLETQIRYYFQKLRDFIIAFGVKKWDKISLKEFQDEYHNLDLKDVQLEALSFFYQFADKEKRNIIDVLIATNAEIYLDFYTSILDKHFYNLRHRFSPETNGLIGFVGEFSIKRKANGMYGFRPIEETDEKVWLIPKEGSIMDYDDNILYLKGATSEHYSFSFNGAKETDIKREVLRYEIYGQLNNIVNRGLLNETENYYLSLEKLLGVIVSRLSKELGIKNRWKLSQYLPITFDDIEYAIRYLKAYNYYENELRENKIQSGEVKPVWNGSIRSCSFSFKPSDLELICAQAHKAAIERKAIDTTYIGLRKVEEAIIETITVVKKRKTVVNETILPDADSTGQIKWMSDHFKETTIKDFIVRLYSQFLAEYKILIESNFPTLKNSFPLYKKMPVHYFITVIHQRNDYGISLHILKCVDPDGNKNEVTLCPDAATPVREEDKWLFAQDGKQYEVFEKAATGLFSGNMNEFINIDKIPREFTILRTLVYKQIKKELKSVFNQLLQEHRITQDG